MDKTQPVQYVQSIGRALDILECLAKSDRSMGVTELGERLGLHKSTVYRLLATLVYRGYVEQDEDERYNIGLKFFEISGSVLNKMDIRKKVKPYLIKLQQETRETIHLGILDGDEVVYIDKEKSTETIRMYSEIGKRVKAYCTSLGKVLLAYKGIDLAELYKKGSLIPYTENTIVDLELLKEHLAEIREKGYAVDNEEQERDIRCVGGPIFDYKGDIVAAFSIAGPSTRMTEKRLEELSRKVLEYSQKISHSLGYNREKGDSFKQG